MPSCTVAGRFGIARTTGTPARDLALDRRGRDRGRDREHRLLGRQHAADLAEQRVEVLRLDGDHDERGAGDRLRVRERRPHAVALLQLAGALLVPDGDDDLAGLPPAAAQEAAQERLADRAGAEDGDAPGSSTGPSLGGCSRQSGTRPLANACKQVDAREPRPLAVRLEQLRRLPALDPAAAQRREQLHEPEVGDEPAVVAAEPLEEDDADRPGAEARARAGAARPTPRSAARAAARARASGRAARAWRRGASPARAAAARRARPAQRLRSPGGACSFVPDSRGVSGADHGALDRAGAARLDQLAADRAQERLGDRRACASGRSPRSRRRASPISGSRAKRRRNSEWSSSSASTKRSSSIPGLARRPQLDDAVRLLPGAPRAAAGERRRPATPSITLRVASPACRQGGAKGERAPRPNRGGDHR